MELSNEKTYLADQIFAKYFHQNPLKQISIRRHFSNWTPKLLAHRKMPSSALQTSTEGQSVPKCSMIYHARIKAALYGPLAIYL